MPAGPVPPFPPGSPRESAWPAPGLTFLGNATTLLRHAGVTLLTDPNFLRRGQAAYLGRGAFSRRRLDPACTPADLPELDAVVLSHLHGDHWDRMARRGLPRTVPVVTTRHAARRLRRQGFAAAAALGTWESYELSRGTATVRITAVPGQHGLGRSRLIAPPPVMGSVIEFAPDAASRPLRVYVSGDTLMYPQLREIGERYPGLDLALLHLGGTRVLGLLLTMDGAAGAALLDLLRPSRAVPIHYDDYGVFRSPLSDFRNAVRARGLDDRVRYVGRGETVPIPLP